MLPVATNYLVSPSYVTTAVTPVPNVFYEPAKYPPFTTFAPQVALYGYEVNKLLQQENYLNSEKLIDERIKQKVKEQIEKYQRDKYDYDEKYEACRSRKSRCDCYCESYDDRHRSKSPNHRSISANSHCLCCKEAKCKNCSNSTTELSLDEKIKIIREELNLPQEKDTKHCHHVHYTDTREVVTPDKPKVIFATDKYEINRPKERQSRSRSKSKTATSRSKSPALSIHDRPLWKPTGANDYPWASQTRADFINREFPTRPSSPTRPKSASSQTDTQTHYCTHAKDKDVNTYEYYEVIPVKSVNCSVDRHRSRSRSKSQPRSQSPWRHTSTNDYSWTKQVHSDLIYNYETSKPSTTQKNTNLYIPHSSDQYYYTSYEPKLSTQKPKNSTCTPYNEQYYYTTSYEPKPAKNVHNHSNKYEILPSDTKYKNSTVYTSTKKEYVYPSPNHEVEITNCFVIHK